MPGRTAVAHVRPALGPEAPQDPSNAEIRQALRLLRKHCVDWWNPWPDEIPDSTVRWLRAAGYCEATECSGAIQMAQNNFGHSWIEDAITEEGRAWLKARRW